MGSPRYKHLILEYFTQHPGVLVHNSELQEACGISKDQVVTGIYALRTNSDVLHKSIHVIDTGRTWSYHPNEGKTEKVPTLTKPVEPALLKPPIKDPFETPKHHTLGTPVVQRGDHVRTASPVGKLFEAVGKTSAKEVIVKDENDDLFKVVPI